MRLGIIGAGMIAELHAKAIGAIDGAGLEAVFARRDDVAADFAERYGCTGYSDLGAFLSPPPLAWKRLRFVRRVAPTWNP